MAIAGTVTGGPRIRSWACSWSTASTSPVVTERRASAARWIFRRRGGGRDVQIQHVQPVQDALGLCDRPAVLQGARAAGMPGLLEPDGGCREGLPCAAADQSAAVAQGCDPGGGAAAVSFLRLHRPGPAAADSGGCAVAVRPATLGAAPVRRAAALPRSPAVDALVAQRIEHRPPEPGAEVRFLSGVLRPATLGGHPVDVPVAGRYGLSSSRVRRLACKASGTGSSPAEASRSRSFRCVSWRPGALVSQHRS